MKQRQQAILEIAARDPAVASAVGYIGPGGPTVTENDGRVFITLKPEGQRNVTADQVIARLTTALQQVQGMRLYMQAAQDITIGSRLSKTQYQFTLVDIDQDELNFYAPKLMAKLQDLPELTAVASDQEAPGRTLKVQIDRAAAALFGITPATIDSTLYDAFGQRHIARIYTALNEYYVILEVNPQYQLGPNALQRIYVLSQNSTMVPLSQIASLIPAVAPVVVNHQGQFPSVTLSFNLAPGATIGAAVSAVQKATADLHLPPSITTSFQGNAQAFQSSLSTTPPLILAALFAVYIILGMLYESTIHPLTILSTLPSAGLGALITLMLVGRPLDVIGIIGIILLDRHREEERHHARRRRARRAARSRTFLRGGDPSRVPSPLPAHSDDNDVRAVRRRSAHARNRHRVRNPATARLCDRRRIAGVPGAHALHHASRLYLHGQDRSGLVGAEFEPGPPVLPTRCGVAERRRQLLPRSKVRVPRANPVRPS